MSGTLGNVTATCQRQMEEVGAGIGASLRGVDCAANAMAKAAFNNLFAEGGFLGPTFTIVLTIFVALLGYALITGRTRIGLASLTPKMVTLVLVVTFATSWFLFNWIFWNLFALGPDWLASRLMGNEGSATIVFADKLDAVMLALMEASGGDAMDANTSVFSPPGLLWSGGTMLLLGTVGVLATTKIALAILMGLGPIFILCALFDATRGLFTGWLKAVVLMALAPLFAVLGGSLMLELAVPVLSSLASTPGEIDVRPAMAFFMIGAVHLALMFMVLKVLSTMVSGWRVFGLVNTDRGHDRAPAAPAPAPYAVNPALTSSRAAERAAENAAPSRRAVRVAATTPLAANDAGSNSTLRETRIISGSSNAPSDSPSGSTPSRVRGIGSRFKSAPKRSTETK
ncbi:type IV secretion system protein [Aurantiacibacter sp. D1-12]|uniref:type IV secretion system protein n=1 Tax=Aurantiacibacter sp. D1-12 TaxID=2993658 RepID=UPI00237C9FA9|nr:type IV secretion system protein [Aurantiacibacter sp. D1-12]MDE1467589.1 type IV secretion system protein [Aurantiacibacter sp. D1-12]